MPAQSTQYFRSIISKDQFRQIMTTAEADSSLHDMLDAVRVLANTGIRPGEFNKLRLRDIDVGKGRAFIGSAIVWRYVPLGSKSQQALIALHDRRAEAEFILGAAPQRLLQRVSRQLCKVGGGQVSFRALRDTFILRLCVAEVPTESRDYICGYASRSNWSSILNADLRYDLAARHFARIDEF
jgi:integrase